MAQDNVNRRLNFDDIQHNEEQAARELEALRDGAPRIEVPPIQATTGVPGVTQASTSAGLGPTQVALLMSKFYEFLQTPVASTVLGGFEANSFVTPWAAPTAPPSAGVTGTVPASIPSIVNPAVGTSGVSTTPTTWRLLQLQRALSLWSR